MRLIPFLFLLALWACQTKQAPVFHGSTMGTTYAITLADTTLEPASVKRLSTLIEQRLKEINGSMSTYIPQSEISRFNKNHTLEPLTVSREFMYVTRMAENIYRGSGGAYDVTVAPLVDLWGFGKNGRRFTPPARAAIDSVMRFIGMDKLIIGRDYLQKTIPQLQLDFSSIAKGYGVDEIARLIRKEGFVNFLVEIGGEVVVSGRRSGQLWRIGVDKPDTSLMVNHSLQRILALTGGAVATSGDYRNYFVSHDSLYSHTMDPRLGQPIVNHVASATVIAPNCTLADAMATALMVMGPEKGLKWVEEQKEIEAMLIMRRGKNYKVIESSGFSRYEVND
ncbi:MAG TPA: FAD:protein FMN transferase [Caldithrix abyssi]|uniref:FAD:protein FMN transferase n=1 Tax=Caldithrix abyssi TaxID=187145 RepID=A0A7V1PTW1_CALAY|nr:FAD:protein FMN transferase [Caldithrix abyssi]